jgi:hypothetical protein
METDRWEKAISSESNMHGSRESSGVIVPTKRSNEGQGGPKEIVEGRMLAEENGSPSTPAPDTVPNEWVNDGWLSCASGRSSRWEPCALAARARFCAGGGQ